MSLRTIALFVLMVSPHLRAADLNVDSQWDTWTRQANSLHRQGNLADAVESGKRALALAKNFDPSDYRLAASYYLVGFIYHDWGHCTEAGANYRRAVELWEKYPGKPRYVFNSIVSLITETTECESVAAAQRLFRSYRAALQRYSSGPSDDAILLSIQGGFARRRKHYAEAEELYRQAIEILERDPGIRPTEIAEIRCNRAVALSFLHRYEESLAESQRAIARLEAVNPHFPNLPSALNNEACTLLYLGRKEESGKVYRRALDLARELFGEDNRNTAKIMLNYAALLRKSDNPLEADALKQKGLDVYRRSLLKDARTVDVSELANDK